MSVLETIILMVVAVVGANIVNLLVPKIPLSLVQIAAGLVLSLVPDFNYQLEPELFMMAIIAPLMFNDGRQESLREIAENGRQILSLAVSLVLVSVLVAGVLANWLWATLSLPLAFMLIAIITPTDAVAVGSVTEGVQLPSSVAQALGREALFNDASGLVLFNLAVATIASGKFSLGGGIVSFLVTFFGGIILGWVIGLLLVSLQMYLTRTHADISAIIIPINILTPLLVYALGEAVGVSGILAAVAAGLAQGMYHTRLQLTSTKMRIVSETTWTIIADLLNGIVFVLLGAALPAVLRAIPLRRLGLLLGIAVLLYLVLFAVRWWWCRMRWARINNHGEASARTATLFALGGVHGTITLAMAFSIPSTLLTNHAGLRGELVFIAAAVILLSLLAAAVGYPLLLPRKKDDFTPEDVTTTTNAMIYYALEQLRLAHPDDAAVEDVTGVLTSQVGLQARTDRAAYTKLVDEVQDVELNALSDQVANGQLSEQTYTVFRQFLRNVTVQAGGPRHIFGQLFNRKHRRRKKRQVQAWQAQAPTADQRATRQQLLKDLTEATRLANEAATTYLNSVQTPDNLVLVNLVRRTLAQRLQRFTHDEEADDQQAVADLYIEAFQHEHTYIQQQVASKKISHALANAMNEQISTDQLVALQSGL